MSPHPPLLPPRPGAEKPAPEAATSLWRRGPPPSHNRPTVALRFTKYEGLGNDFVLLDGEDARSFSPSLVPDVCDRHRGIGADGVLLSLPAAPPCDATMVVWNRDGSRPEMCGNGLRCFALHLALRRGLTEATVATDAGPRHAAIDLGAGKVTIELGLARHDGRLAHRHQGWDLEFLLVSMGNPHAVALQPADPLTETDLDRLAPEVASRFPEGLNVELVRLDAEGRAHVLVWERGVGRTLACGTGAGATAAALASLGQVPWDVPLDVVLPGGPLRVTPTGTGHVLLEGPARRVFSGELA